tara:strand:+ start:3662 stop:3937 length:276 start_codon:yes stop_codon:yes gene_type:complete
MIKNKPIDDDDPFDSSDKYIVYFDKLESLEGDYIVYFGETIAERRFAGHANKDKIKTLLTRNQQYYLKNNESFSFYVKKQRLFDAFEDVYN